MLLEKLAPVLDLIASHPERDQLRDLLKSPEFQAVAADVNPSPEKGQALLNFLQSLVAMSPQIIQAVQTILSLIASFKTGA